MRMLALPATHSFDRGVVSMLRLHPGYEAVEYDLDEMRQLDLGVLRCIPQDVRPVVSGVIHNDSD